MWSIIFINRFPFIKRRMFNAVCFISCLALIIAAICFEKYGLEFPCPLCLIQRYLVGLLGIVFFIAAVVNFKHVPSFSKLMALIILLVSLAGAASSIRHIWIQMLPDDQVPACTAPLDALVKEDGIFKTFQTIYMEGSGDCHDSSWRFLWLTMPMWVLIWFAGFAITGFIVNWFDVKEGSV